MPTLSRPAIADFPLVYFIQPKGSGAGHPKLNDYFILITFFDKKYQKDDQNKIIF